MERASSRPIWSGSISFGLVTIPVKLFTAVRENRLSFRSLHDQDKVPLKQKLYCPEDGKEVHPEHIVKGFEIEKDRYVIVQQEELEAAAPKATRAIEIQDFVDLDEIDPVYFDRPYYIAPRPEGAKPYRLLLEAMQRKEKVGIARIVMHNKEYLAAIRPIGDMLCMETMHFGDEVVNAKTVEGIDVKAKVNPRELKIAEQLIDSLSTDWKPERYHDEYREQVMDMIRRKADGEEIVTRPGSDDDAKKTRKAGDLIAALEASLASAKSGGKERSPRAVRHARANGHARVNGHNGHSHARRRKSA
jgi:DNA end-binding protein Ku